MSVACQHADCHNIRPVPPLLCRTLPTTRPCRASCLEDPVRRRTPPASFRNASPFSEAVPSALRRHNSLVAGNFPIRLAVISFYSLCWSFLAEKPFWRDVNGNCCCPLGGTKSPSSPRRRLYPRIKRWTHHSHRETRLPLFTGFNLVFLQSHQVNLADVSVLPDSRSPLIPEITGYFNFLCRSCTEAACNLKSVT
jgi:hypothetical protein